MLLPKIQNEPSLSHIHCFIFFWNISFLDSITLLNSFLFFDLPLCPSLLSIFHISINVRINHKYDIMPLFDILDSFVLYLE